MGPSASSGSHGQANVGVSTISTVMNSWAIPDQIRTQAVARVRLLVLAAAEGTYSAQAFSFDVTSGVSLTTLIVVATRLSVPTNPSLPVGVMYVTINTNAPLKQLYTYWMERTCHTCPKCVWLSKCCCHNNERSAPRGHSLEETYTVKQKITADQYIWFSQQRFTSHVFKALVQRSIVNGNTTNQNSSLKDAIQKYLSNNSVKAEVLASYTDPIITAFQSNLTSLKLSTQALKLNKVQRKNLPIILMALAEEHGFDDMYSYLNDSQQLDQPQFSYENLFTPVADAGSDHLSIKYIWILAQVDGNSTYSIDFLSVDMTSKALIQITLLNTTVNSTSPHANDQRKLLNIVRTSSLAFNGAFVNEHLVASITSWQNRTSQVVLNMLRFLSASVLVPQKLRMLSSFDLELAAPGATLKTVSQDAPKNVTNKLTALTNSIATILGTASSIIQTLKSSKSLTIDRIIRFGFTYFNQKSTIMKVIDIPNSRVDDFVRALILDYDLPSKGSFMLGLQYSDDFTWDQIQYLYSPEMNGKYRSLTLFKNGDSVKNTASFYIVDVDADWTLAPDLLLITKTKSVLGGLYSSTSQSLEQIPHMLTMDEAVKLQQFFMLVATGNMASNLGLTSNIA